METKKLLSLLLGFIPTIASAQLQIDSRQIGREAAALISYVKMIEMGAADPDCKGVLFVAQDVNSLLTRTVVPTMEALARKDGRSAPDVNQLIAEFQKQVASPPAVQARETAYRRMKAQAIQAYGTANHCAALSMSMATVVQQKQLLLETLRTTK
ncbi:hypothetical protein [Aromatoleum bremense]|uniref:DUF2059 domain-containing protein n=1 Tax=Aromatoleum bremense TaxID=76115 RepID=A0ABX1NZZ0_9RHOO|nr:hypothetical protein [Aromatoleum bremense]NMG17634.1 hypothetical protein [Aromatoleum bremense]